MAYYATGLLIASALTGAYATYQQGVTTSKIAQNNAVMAEQAAQDAQRRGELAAQQARRNSDALAGRQRAMMAANGLDLGVGTAADIQAQTDFFKQSDQNTIRYNAAKEAWGDRVQAGNFRGQASASELNGDLMAAGTVLGSGSAVANKWRMFSMASSN